MRSTACIFLIVVSPSFGRGTKASSSSSEVFQVARRASLSASSPSWGEPSVIIFSLVLMMAKRVGLNSTSPFSYEHEKWNVMLSHRMIDEVPGLGCWGKGDGERQAESDIRFPSPTEEGYVWKNLITFAALVKRKPEQWKQLRLREFSLAANIKLPPDFHKITLLIVGHWQTCQEKNTDQMMRTQNWAVLYEVIEVIHDNSNKEVEDEKATDEDERGEEEVGEVGSTACADISFVWVWITGSCLGRE